jgi:Glu-tRNA(Gln) amidotransferase subunit E-like FAD-binding protein
MGKEFTIGLMFLFAFQVSALAGPYEECIKANLEKAKTEAAVTLIKEICENDGKQTKNLCESKKASELTNEELCECIGLVYDEKENKCK